MGVREGVLRRTIVVAVAVFCLFIMVTGAFAQQALIYPILYGGTAYVDGQPAPEGATIVAKVGDKEYTAVVQQNGAYLGLLVAPPDKSYYLMPITFHLDGMTATETDVFLPANAPTFKDTGYNVHFVSLVSPTLVPTGGATVTPLPTPLSPIAPEETPVFVSSTPQPTAGNGRGNAGGRTGAWLLLGIAVVGVLVGGGVYRVTRLRKRR